MGGAGPTHHPPASPSAHPPTHPPLPSPPLPTPIPQVISSNSRALTPLAMPRPPPTHPLGHLLQQPARGAGAAPRWRRLQLAQGGAALQRQLRPQSRGQHAQRRREGGCMAGGVGWGGVGWGGVGWGGVGGQGLAHSTPNLGGPAGQLGWASWWLAAAGGPKVGYSWRSPARSGRAAPRLPPLPPPPLPHAAHGEVLLTDGLQAIFCDLRSGGLGLPSLQEPLQERCPPSPGGAGVGAREPGGGPPRDRPVNLWLFAVHCLR